MKDKPNTELLSDIFNSEGWGALKIEIEQCLANAMYRLKREGEINREFQAGVVNGYETILDLEEKYKNADIKPNEPNK